MYTLTIYSIVQLCPNLVAHLLCNPMSKLLPQAVTDNWTLTTNDVYRLCREMCYNKLGLSCAKLRFKLACMLRLS